MIRAVFFDVDQTLLSHHLRRIPANALKALERLKEKGILVFISTGRHMHELDVLDIDPFAYDGYNILNGQMCLDRNRKAFFETPITGDDREALLSLYHAGEVPVILIGRERMYINFVNDDVRAVLSSVPAPAPELSPFEGEDVFMGGIYCPKEKDSEYNRFFSGLRLARWNRYAADVIPVGDGKVKGIRVFLDRFGLRREQVMAFGDEENDIGMLRFAGTGVAMGNARDTVKEAADYVTTDVDDDGVWNALDHFGLL